MWFSELVAQGAGKDAERELKEFRRWLDTPPPTVQKKTKPKPRWTAEDEMALFESAKQSMKGE